MRRAFAPPMLVVLVALVQAILAAPAGAVERALWPGVTYERGVQFTPNGPVALSILRGPRPDGITTLEPLLSNESIVGRETLSAMQRRLASVTTTAGVNADLFELATGRPSGVFMREGQLVAPPRPSRSSLGITSDGTLDIRRIAFFGTWQGSGPKRTLATFNATPGATQAALFTDAYGGETPALTGATAAVLFPFPAAAPGADLRATVGYVTTDGLPVEIPRGGAVVVARGALGAALAAEAAPEAELVVRLQLRPDWSGVVAAVGGGPQIVRAGAPIFRANEAFTSLQLGQRTARSAVGQTADGRVLLVAVDGRQPFFSVGVTNFELAQALVRLGAVTAMALDGGGSTTLAFDGTVLNSPAGTGERPIATALVFAYQGVFVTGSTIERVSPNGDGVDDDARLAVRVVRLSQVRVKLTGPSGVVVETDEPRLPGTVALQLPRPASIGAWTLEASALDDLGRQTTMTRSFVVDDTLGFLRVPRAYVIREGAKPLPITFTLARPAPTSVQVLGPSGRVVRSLKAGSLPQGLQRLSWDGTSAGGAKLTSGTYTIRVRATSPAGRSELLAPVAVTIKPVSVAR